jgi:PAS domain S-box-containing protein
MAFDRREMLSSMLQPGTLAKAGALALCYFLAAKASLLLAIPPGYATAVWPPSGIALAALLLYGTRVWPGVWVGALLANVMIGPSLALAAAIATGNTLEAILAAWLARGFLDGGREFLRVESVFRFALIAVVGGAVAATIGVVSLQLSGRILPGELLENWYTWWQGDVTGIIVVTPLLLAWLSPDQRRAAQTRPLEVVLFGALFGLAFCAVLALGWWVGTDIARSLIFLLIPFMAWAGCRFDQRTVTATIIVVTGAAVWATLNSRSPFLFSSRDEALLTLQAFTSTVALMGLVLCGLTRQRQQAIETLQRGSDQLEAMVVDRTQELAAKNRDLARDIVEKERLASTLQAREGQLAEAQAITHVGSWDWDVKTDRVTWSDELFRIYGIAPDDFAGTYADYLSRVHPEDRERVDRAVYRAMREREPWESTERIVRPDGSVRVLKTIGRILTDVNGDIRSLYGACLDTTEATRMEQIRTVQIRVTTALLEAPSWEQAIEGAMRSLCEGLDWAIGQTWQVDPGAGQMRQTLSWPADPGETNPLVVQSRSVAFERGDGLPGRCWQRQAIVWVEDVLADPQFRRKEGAREAGLHGAFAFPLIAGDHVLGAMEFFHGASQRPQKELTPMLTALGNQLGEYIVRNRAQLLLRQSEERFRVLVQGVKEYAIFMLDPDGYVTTWNPGAERIKGYRADEIIGAHYSRFFPPEDLAVDAPSRELAAAARQGQIQGEGWRVRKDGSRFWANAVLTALHDENGRLRGFAKVTRDMSDRKRLEALEDAGRQTRQFLAMLAHELRNPLAPIRNAVNVMRVRDLGDPQLRACRDIVERQVEHLTRLVDDLFDLSRITSGKVALQRAPIDATWALTRAVETVRPFIDTRNQTLEIALPEQPVVVDADLTRLAQVVQNLLHNSAKYTPPGGRIVLSLQREGDVAVIRVRDNGIGMASDLLPKVFDLFLQGERPTDASDGGLGIGLTLVRQLVELHGGSVEASSEGPGRGAEFVVRLPCRPSNEAPTLPKEKATASESQDASEGCRILVVDDNRDSAESMALLLRLSGHETWLAFDGNTAVSLAAEHAPDAVLLDIGLPGMDGYQVASRLRELPQTSHSLLIALTGYGQEEDRQRSRAAGFSEHFVKPVDPESLFRAIARHRRAGDQRL